MRIVFFGSGSFSLAILDYLLKFRRNELLAVVTQPDKKAGRKRYLKYTEVKNYLIKSASDIKIYQPDNVNDNGFIEQCRILKPDLFIVVSFGQILGSKLLNIPTKFALNIHASLLPKYRGAAPINWAIINREKVTGLTILRMNEKMDAGEIMAQASCQILPEDNTLTIERKLSHLSVKLFIKLLEEIETDSVEFHAQEGVISYAPKLKKTDGLINWNLDAESIWNRVRGLHPWPIAYTYLKGKIFKIYSAQVSDWMKGKAGEIVACGKESIKVKCGKGALEVFEVQLEGRRRMKVKEFLIGHKIKVGEKLGA